MSKLSSVLALTVIGSVSIDTCAEQNHHVARVKHHSHDKEKTTLVKKEVTSKPIRNEEWYLSQARSSERFKATALGTDRTGFSPRGMESDQLMQQATVSNQPIVENSKKSEALIKNASSSAKSDEVTFMFVPPFINNKLMDLQKRSDMHSVVTLSWKQ